MILLFILIYKFGKYNFRVLLSYLLGITNKHFDKLFSNSENSIFSLMKILTEFIAIFSIFFKTKLNRHIKTRMTVSQFIA